MAKYLVHVNRHTITRNKRNGTNEPDIAVRRGRSSKAEYANSVDILDANGNVVATIGSHRDRPLPCGATVWLECLYGVAMHVESSGDSDLPSDGSGELPATTACIT